MRCAGARRPAKSLGCFALGQSFGYLRYRNLLPRIAAGQWGSDKEFVGWTCHRGSIQATGDRMMPTKHSEAFSVCSVDRKSAGWGKRGLDRGAFGGGRVI